MIKNIYILFFVLLTVNLEAQEELFIQFNTQHNGIGNVYILEPSGLFVLSNKAKLEAIIIGNFTKNQVTTVIYDYENNRIRNRFHIDDFELFTYGVSEINYPDKNATIDEAYKDLPISINNIKIEYYHNYYDDDCIKGRVKSVGNTKLEYYQEYYLDERIKGSVAKIGRYNIELSNSTYEPKSFGFINKIGDIIIKYSKANYEKSLNGLIIAIGNYKINYFDDIYDKRHLGQFKKLEGSDHRFVLLEFGIGF